MLTPVHQSLTRTRKDLWMGLGDTRFRPNSYSTFNFKTSVQAKLGIFEQLRQTPLCILGELTRC